MKKILTVMILLLFIGLCIIPSTGIRVIEQSIKPIYNGNILYVGGSGEGNHESGMTAIHTYEYQGAYPLKLIVEDNDGNTANDTS